MLSYLVDVSCGVGLIQDTSDHRDVRVQRCLLLLQPSPLFLQDTNRTPFSLVLLRTVHACKVQFTHSFIYKLLLQGAYADKLQVKAAKFLPLVGLARSMQDCNNRGHQYQYDRNIRTNCSLILTLVLHSTPSLQSCVIAKQCKACFMGKA